MESIARIVPCYLQEKVSQLTFRLRSFLVAVIFLVTHSQAADPCEEYIDKLGYEPEVWKDISSARERLRSTSQRSISAASASLMSPDAYRYYLESFGLFVENSKQYECGLLIVDELLQAPMLRNDSKHKRPLIRLRAKYLANTGRYDEAKLAYEKLLDASIANPLGAKPIVFPYYELAFFLSTCPDLTIRDGKRAIELAKRAVELTNKQSGLFDEYTAMAAAYAQERDFTTATKYQSRAIDDLNETRNQYRSFWGKPNRGYEVRLVKYRAYLDSYKNNKPWREKEH